MPKGRYDRTTSAWRPKPKTVYPPELVADVRRHYEAGHTMAEVAEIVGTTVRVLQRLMPRNGITRRTSAKRDQRGERNHMWRGASANYQALHLRVRSRRGAPDGCEYGCEGKTEWANVSGDYADVNDYMALCKPCHRTLDLARRQYLGWRTGEVVSNV